MGRPFIAISKVGLQRKRELLISPYINWTCLPVIHFIMNFSFLVRVYLQESTKYLAPTVLLVSPQNQQNKTDEKENLTITTFS